MAYCTQVFMVLDEKGNYVEGAKVAVSGSCYTSSNGKCSISIHEGDEVTAKASKDGYFCRVIGGVRYCERAFTTCVGGGIVLKLNKGCEQTIMVLDPANYLEGATVKYSCDDWQTTYWLRTKADGKAYDMETGKLPKLDKGVTYKTIASKTGYKCYVVDSVRYCEAEFVACASKVLKLAPEAAPCSQSFRVVEIDEGYTIQDATVIVTTQTADKTERGRCVTGYSGTCGVHDLTEDEWLWGCAEHPDYEYVSASCKGFQACTSEITLKLKKDKTETKLTCHRATTTEGSSATLTAKLEYVLGLLSFPLIGKTVRFVLDGVIKESDTGAEGIVAVTYPKEDVPSPGTHTYSASFGGDGDYESFMCYGELSVEPLGGWMTKQEFIDKIVEVGGGEPIDYASLPGYGMPGQWSYYKGHNAILWYKSGGIWQIWIYNIRDLNPPSAATDVYFRDAGGDSVDTLGKDWLIERINELPLPKAPYVINVLVKDQDGNALPGAYVDIDYCRQNVSCPGELGWEEKKCQEEVITIKGCECSTDEFKGDSDNIKITNADGIAIIGLPNVPTKAGYSNKGYQWGFRVGKTGYLDPTSQQEDWTVHQRTTPVAADGTEGGTFTFEFTLKEITEEDKITIHTKGFPEGEHVRVIPSLGRVFGYCMYAWPVAAYGKGIPDTYPDGTVILTPGMVLPNMPEPLEEGKEYAIEAPQSMGYTWCGELRGTKGITVYQWGGLLAAVCDLMGMDSDECSRFWLEMADPIYCANCITGVLTGKDTMGNDYTPGTFELAMFPVVVVCAFLPMVPGATITKSLGKILGRAKHFGKSADYLKDDYLKIYRIQVYGDETRLKNWADAIDAGNIDGPGGAKAIADDIIAHPAAGMTDAKAVDNFNSWLDDLEVQIKNIDKSKFTDPDEYAKILADQQRRVREAADACMKDVTDFHGVYDTKYPEFIDVARKGNADTRVATFVRAADNVCSPTPFCKLSVVNAMDTLKVGGTNLDLLEYTKFIYNHGAHTTDHDGFVHALRLLAVSDESDIIALRTILKNDNWLDFQSWTHNVLTKFDINYSSQISFFDNERVRILAQWAADRVDDIMGTSGFHDEVARLLDDLVKNVQETKKVVGDSGTYAKTVSLNAVTEPDAAAKTVVKLMDNAPDVEHNVQLGSIWVTTETATALGYLSKGRASRWTNDLVHAAMDDTHVYAYLKYDRARLTEAIGKGELTKLDEFVAALKRGDVDSARIKLNEAVSGTPVGSIDHTYAIVRDTEKMGEDALDSIRIELRDFTDEVCEGTWARAAKNSDDLKRVVDGPENASFTQIFRRGGRRIYDRIGLLRGAAKKHNVPVEVEGKLYDLTKITITEGETGARVTQHLVPHTSGLIGWLTRNKWWSLIIGSWVFVMIPWYGLDNACFLVYVLRAAGVIPEPWGVQWDDAKDRRENAFFALKDDPCVTYYQEQYVAAVDTMDTLLKGAKPIPTDKIEHAKYILSVVYGFHIGDPNESLLENCKTDFNAWSYRYFTLTQSCHSVVKPTWTIDVPRQPELIENVEKVVDGDTFDVWGEDLEWPFGETMRVRFLGIDTIEGSDFAYRIRRQTDFGGKTGDIEEWWGDKDFYDAVKLWMTQHVKGHLVNLHSDENRRYDDYRRFLAAPIMVSDGMDISEEELKLGYGPVRFYLPNKVVDATRQAKYLAAEKIAKDAVLGVWKFEEKCSCSFDKATYNINDVAELKYANAPSDGKLSLYNPDGTRVLHKDVSGNSSENKTLDMEGTWKLTLTGTDCSDEDTATVGAVCPPPEASFYPSESIIFVDDSVKFTDTSTGGGTQKIKSWAWDFKDGHTSTEQKPTHQFKIVGSWKVELTVTNDCVPAKSDDCYKTITVKEQPIPPPDKGNLTIMTFEDMSFSVARAIETILVSGNVVKTGGNEVTVKNLEVDLNPHIVKILGKDDEFDPCYADLTDECLSPCDGIEVNVIKDQTVTLNVCMSRYVYFSAFSGYDVSPLVATYYIKPYGVLGAEYREITTGELVPLGRHQIKTVADGHETLVMVISVSESGVVCEYPISTGASCYESLPSLPAHGLYCHEFRIDAFLKKGVMKTVTFASVPDDAIVEILD